MATYGAVIRRGLPRTPGGEAWPPAGDAPVPAEESAQPSLAESAQPPVAESAQPPVADRAQPHETTPAPREQDEPVEASPDSSRDRVPAHGVVLRRGLPRVPGGEPWPPAAAAAPSAPSAEPAQRPVVERVRPDEAAPPAAEQEERVDSSQLPSPDDRAAASPGVAVRRGLPRTPGGEPWPPADFVPAPADAVPAPADAVAAPADAVPAPADAESAPAEVVPAPSAAEPTPARVIARADRVETTAPGARAPLPFPRTVIPGAAAARWNRDRATGVPVPAAEPQRYGPFTRLQWAGAVIVGGLGLLFAAVMVVLAVRWLVSLDGLRDFMRTYPGEYHLPVGAPVGFPAWVGWQHFFNVFLIVLIIRSGWRVRAEKRPSAFWSPRNNPKRKISLTLWFHQSLDILWLVNGVVFVVLLFVTGQWLRIVPTSWEVFPNALTAALRYASLNWPTEDGWVNYNALQQLAYFATVFLAAPLAAITGVRMSGVWPKDAKALNKAYPVEWARAIHFPVMIYFVLFIVVHVVLVFATGALRNLNHMYGGSDNVNWVGFWIFVASMVVVAAGWIAARPLVLAPIARLFGRVSGR